MAEKFILMSHPDIDAPPTPVSARAWEKVWQAKGWVKVETDTPPTNAGKRGKKEEKGETPSDPESPTPSPDTPPTDTSTSE